MASSGEYLIALSLGGILGAMGQSIRVIVGNKKRNERGESFKGNEVLMSLLIGAAAGSLGMFAYLVQATTADTGLDSTLRLGITLNGQADDMVDIITAPGSGWETLANGIAARQAADTGKLVLAGLKSTGHDPAAAHGHVAVVVAGPLAHERYPSAYWGSLGGTGSRNRTINYAWKARDRDKVHYVARNLA